MLFAVLPTLLAVPFTLPSPFLIPPVRVFIKFNPAVLALIVANPSTQEEPVLFPLCRALLEVSPEFSTANGLSKSSLAASSAAGVLSCIPDAAPLPASEKVSFVFWDISLFCMMSEKVLIIESALSSDIPASSGLYAANCSSIGPMASVIVFCVPSGNWLQASIICCTVLRVSSLICPPWLAVMACNPNQTPNCSACSPVIVLVIPDHISAIAVAWEDSNSCTASVCFANRAVVS